MTEALWPQLLSSALVGTGRRPCRPLSVPGPLATVLGEAPAELEPPGLLSATAALTVARRAGAMPVRVPVPDPAPQETGEVAPHKASVRLGLLLLDAGSDHRQRRSLLREWLELAQQRNFLAAPRHLSALVDAATADPTLRPAVIAVGGLRLGWLAAQGPGRWAWIEQPGPSVPDIDEWHTGRTAARVRYLESLRANDPAQGAALLAQVWQQERAADLAALIGACAEGLGAEDEVWLERALDDKRVQIREAAVQLLAAIPGSAYLARMADRALACCQVTGSGQLTVTPPAQFDAAMRRDALTQKSPQGWGERAWWLVQVVSAAPLRCWSALDSDPARLLDYQIGDDWAGVLREGWLRATVAQRDEAWALRLCRLPVVRGAHLTELAAILPAGTLAELAGEALRQQTDRIADLLSAAPPPWPPALADVVIAWLDRSAAIDDPGWWHLLNVIERSLHPAAVSAVNEILARCGEGRYREILERLALTLQTRYDMHQEFA
ncbi:hypothetical protein Rhe02_82980 [Rhizocola hellebori]|uniref:Uncharacterized protein n=1 Tax=Rhizocola hellebori TaxID=1392758 RepID=A0A8J3QGM1_9ACTN|nr:DUF5691 domain-containing protein [Rhizocola hellebori]GIH10231.1 hypothetical protein Rhe02_82980 [Rhizocola hellebori]